VALYEERPKLVEAELWDGQDPAPIDAMMTRLFGADYLGSEVLGEAGYLELRGQGDLTFFMGNATADVYPGQMLTYGPIYGGYRGEARWGMVPAEKFHQTFAPSSEPAP
jgi:hypothetical protein